jgi:3-dehydroquinate synthase
VAGSGDIGGIRRRKGKNVLIVTNDRIAPLCLDKYTKLFQAGGNLEVDTLVLPDGEEYKNMEIPGRILDKCLEDALDRRATLVALGGGVIGDMVGFADAISSGPDGISRSNFSLCASSSKQLSRAKVLALLPSE